MVEKRPGFWEEAINFEPGSNNESKQPGTAVPAESAQENIANPTPVDPEQKPAQPSQAKQPSIEPVLPVNPEQLRQNPGDDPVDLEAQVDEMLRANGEEAA